MHESYQLAAATVGRLSLSPVIGRCTNETGLLGRFDPASHNGALIPDDGVPEVWSTSEPSHSGRRYRAPSIRRSEPLLRSGFVCRCSVMEQDLPVCSCSQPPGVTQHGAFRACCPVGHEDDIAGNFASC